MLRSRIADARPLGFRRAAWYCCALGLAAATGCNSPAAKVAAPQPPEVEVVRPTQQEFTEYEEFSGHVWAEETIDVRARVSGYLDQVLFGDGDLVKQGQPLFQVDPRPYRTEVDRTAAAVEQSQSRLARLEIQLARAQKLIGDSAISQEEVDILQSDRNEAEAAFKAAKANREMAELNLHFSEIRSPIDGRISRRLVDRGNLVKADETSLATLVSVDPVDVYFDVDERTVLRIRRLHESQSDLPRAGRVEVELSLADKADFSLRGSVDFVDNQLDPNTGTLRMRAKVQNSRQLLSPGMFVRCRYPIGSPRQGLLVPEDALGSDQGQPFLYVVDGHDEVVYRRVGVGPLIGGRRVVLDNLAADERVIVSGLQRVRPGIKVAPKTSRDDAAAAVAGGQDVGPANRAAESN